MKTKKSERHGAETKTSAEFFPQPNQDSEKIASELKELAQIIFEHIVQAQDSDKIKAAA